VVAVDAQWPLWNALSSEMPREAQQKDIYRETVSP
jgi:hypothetical protein